MKKFIVCLIFVIAGFWFLPSEGHAFSLKVRGGTSVYGEAFADATTSSSTYTGISMFFYEGQTWDFFLGYDQVKQEATMKNLPITSEIKFSGSGSTANLGFHYKFSTEWYVKPYLSLEMLYPISVSSEYTIKSSDPSRITFTDNEVPPFGARGGIGIEREITEKLSIGLEFSAAVLPFKYKYIQQDKGNQNVQSVYTDPALQVDINLGLRYFF